MSLEKAHLDEFCKKLEEIGWKEIEPTNLEGVLRLDIFTEKIKEINRHVFEEYEEEKIFPQLFSALNNADEVKILEFLRYGVTVLIKQWNAMVPVTIKLIDYENPEKNSFNYSREQEFTYGNITIRPDIVLYVNGIPLVVVEGKSPLLPEEKPFFEGLRQIMRYQKENPELFKFVQFGIATDGENSPYIPTFPRKEIVKPSNFSFWKDKEKREENIFLLLDPHTLIEFVRYFIFFTKDKKGERTKILARYMQYYATKRVMERIHKYLKNIEDKNRGLIWHWQGSGKTYTMFFVANQFLHEYQTKNPLVFLVIDRVELQRQFEDVLKAIEHKRLGKAKIVERIEELKTIIENAENEWGLKVVTIQKFQPRKLDISNKITKKEILFLIDEAHRSQYGDLAAVMRKIFSHAIFVGFTGTPVFRKERNTFKHFAYPPEELYLDVYFIKHSQEDGFTLPITYRLIEEKDVKIALSEEEIKTIIEGFEKDEEITEKIISGELAKYIKTKLRKKINHHVVFLTDEKRIKKVVEYIKKCIREDTENFKFKAMIVAANRKACVIYKRIMDEYFGSDFSEVVMSYQPNETDDEIHSFKIKMIEKYNTSSLEEINLKIREKFLKEDKPKVLIVTDMLLTGFDAPILKVMYLDKPIQFHRLLQAIARVNRPCPELEKDRGLVVDSVGLFKHLKRSMEIYNYLAEENPEKIKEDLKNAFSSGENELRILEKNISTLREKLKELYEIDVDVIKEAIKNNDISVYGEFLEKISFMALSYGKDENVNKLIQLIKETLKIYKNLGAEPGKVDYLWDIKVLSLIYTKFWSRIKTKKALKEELWDAIIKWVHESTLIKDFEEKLEKEIEVKHMRKPLIMLATDYFELQNIVQEKLTNPLYREIYERLERLREQWKIRNIGIEEFLNEVSKLREKVEEYERIENKLPWEKITEFANMHLQNKIGKKEDFSKIERKIKEIFERGKLLETDKKEINLEIAKLLLKTKMPYEKRREIEKELVELIFDEIRRSLWMEN